MPKVVLPLHSELTDMDCLKDSLLLHSETINKRSGGQTLLSLLVRYKPDLIHDHGAWLPFHLKIFLLAKFLRIPYVLSPHGNFEAWAMSHKGLKKKFAWHLYQKFIVKYSSALVVNSFHEYSRLRELGFKNKIAIIPNGVEFPVDRSGVDQEIKLPVKKALFFSRINPIKGVLELLEAWKASSALEFGYVLNIYGNSDDESYLARVKSRIAELGLGDSVFLRGAVYGSEKWRIYKEHDFFILPSYSENFGIVVAEALFSGLPVITTDGAPWHHLDEMGFGKTVSLQDQSLRVAIDEYMIKFGKKDGVPAEIRFAASQYAADNFSWPEIALKYSEFYKWLLGQGEAPLFLKAE